MLEAGQITDLMNYLLAKVAPALIPLVAITGPSIKYAVDLARKFLFPHLQGNVIQTVTFFVALCVVIVQAAISGMYSDGLDVREAVGIVLVAGLNSSVATWVDQLTSDKNKPKDGDGPDDDLLGFALDPDSN